MTLAERMLKSGAKVFDNYWDASQEAIRTNALILIPVHPPTLIVSPNEIDFITEHFYDGVSPRTPPDDDDGKELIPETPRYIVGLPRGS